MKWVRTELEVRYVECDPMGVVHHSNYIRWFEMGRYDYVKDMCIGISQQADFYLPVIDVQCKYKKSALFGDYLLLETAMEKPRKAMLKFHYKLYRKHGRTLLATGESEHVFTTTDGRLLLRMPEVVQEKINGIDWGESKK